MESIFSVSFLEEDLDFIEPEFFFDALDEGINCRSSSDSDVSSNICIARCIGIIDLTVTLGELFWSFFVDFGSLFGVAIRGVVGFWSGDTVPVRAIESLRSCSLIGGGIGASDSTESKFSNFLKKKCFTPKNAIWFLKVVF